MKKNTRDVGNLDIEIGARIRHQRHKKGLSARNLGNLVEVTSEQIIKYERGINRISASRLFRVAKALNTPIAFFLKNLL